jgi:hypothetical protein
MRQLIPKRYNIDLGTRALSERPASVTMSGRKPVTVGFITRRERLIS